MPECLHCRAPFHAKRPWQKFCSTAHKDAYHAAARRSTAGLLSRVTELELELARAKGEGRMGEGGMKGEGMRDTHSNLPR